MENKDELLNIIRSAYVVIQTEVQRGVNHGNLNLAILTDGLRSRMRNAISLADGIDGQELQEKVEEIARETAKL